MSADGSQGAAERARRPQAFAALPLPKTAAVVAEAARTMDLVARVAVALTAEALEKLGVLPQSDPKFPAAWAALPERIGDSLAYGRRCMVSFEFDRVSTHEMAAASTESMAGADARALALLRAIVCQTAINSAAHWAVLRPVVDLDFTEETILAAIKSCGIVKSNGAVKSTLSNSLRQGVRSVLKRYAEGKGSEPLPSRASWQTQRALRAGLPRLLTQASTKTPP
jgi:hypothetical protein